MGAKRSETYTALLMLSDVYVRRGNRWQAFMVLAFCYLSWGCGALDPPPLQDIPTQQVLPPVFVYITADPNPVVAGEDSVVRFKVISPDATYEWRTVLAGQAEGTLNVSSGIAKSGEEVQIIFHSGLPSAAVEVGVIAKRNVNGGVRSSTGCVCLVVLHAITDHYERCSCSTFV